MRISYAVGNKENNLAVGSSLSVTQIVLDASLIPFIVRGKTLQVESQEICFPALLSCQTILTPYEKGKEIRLCDKSLFNTIIPVGVLRRVHPMYSVLTTVVRS